MENKIEITAAERTVINDLATEVVERRNSHPFRQLVESFRPEMAKAAEQIFRSYVMQSNKRADQISSAWSYLGLAMVISGQRQYQTALKYLDRAHASFSLIGEDLGLACVYREMSYAHREQDRNALSLEYAHKAVIIFDSLKRQIDLGWMYDNLSVIFSNMGRRPESLSFMSSRRLPNSNVI